MTTIAASLTVADAAAGARVWDAVVIGAGPAGSLAARELARNGASVLLVDRAVFPRDKVCGCCLNVAALRTLGRVGLRGLSRRLGGRSLEVVDLRAGRARALLNLPGGMAVSRAALDAALVREAMETGAAFLPGVSARVLAVDGCEGKAVVSLAGSDARARAVVVADGLGGHSLDGVPALHVRVARSSRFGAGTRLSRRPRWLHAGAIHLTCGRGGYVGAVMLEDGSADVAACFDPAFVRACGGPARAGAALLEGARLDAGGLREASWRGTGLLTRSRRVQAGRVFVAGDAAGYVEPFTGEGMAWAMAGGVSVAPHVLGVVRGTDPARSEWARAHRALIGRRFACRALTRALRRPWLVRAALRVLACSPDAAGGLIESVAHGTGVPA